MPDPLRGRTTLKRKTLMILVAILASCLQAGLVGYSGFRKSRARTLRFPNTQLTWHAAQGEIYLAHASRLNNIVCVTRG